MIDATKIEDLINDKLQGSDLFLVSVKVTRSNVITVTIDGDNGVKVEDCIALSKYIESNTDRDVEDYSLTVTSFGLDEYFVSERQLRKNIGRNVEVILEDGEKESGLLDAFDGKTLTLLRKKQKEPLIIDKENIVKAKVIITF